jgi:hypothetical protein
MINPENKKPNFPAKPNYTKPLPKSSDARKIPPRDHLPAINGLPGSTGPRPLANFDKK